MVSPSTSRMILWLALLCAALSPLAPAGGALAQGTNTPIRKEGLISALKELAKLTPDVAPGVTRALIQTIKHRGVDFEYTGEVEAELLRAGASSKILQAVRAGYRRPRLMPTPAPTPLPTPLPTPAPTPARGYLSAHGRALSADAASRLGPGGARGFVVEDVRAGGAAERGGLRAGDIVTAVNGTPIADEGNFRAAISPLRPGSEARLTVWRGGRSLQLGVVVEALPPSVELVERASAELQRSNADEAVALLRQAIKLDPEGRDAYQLLGPVLLYRKGQFRDAAGAMLQTLGRGGLVVFRLSHDHSNGTFQSSCSGSLTLAKNVLSFAADDGLHNFRAGYGDIRDLRPGGPGSDSFTLKLAAAGEYRFSTNAPLTPAGAQKFSAPGLAPSQRRQLFADEARLIVELVGLPLR